MQSILDRLNGVERYNPLSASTFGDWATEAGDVVKVVRDGDEYNVPVHSSTLLWRGKQKLEIDSTGKKERDSIAQASAQKYGRGGNAVRATQYIHYYVEDQYNQLVSGLELTGSTAALYVESKYNQMRSGLDLTSSTAALYVDSKYDQMKAGLDLTSSSASLYVDSKYDQMRAGLDLTSSTVALYVDSKYDQMKAGLDLTSSSASLYVDSKYDQMRSGLDLTSSTAALYVDSKYDQMKAGLDLTSSSASLYVDSKYDQMRAGLDLTSSSASVYVDSKYDQMRAGLDLTSSSASVYVDSKYDQMRAGLDLTSSSASVYVDSKYDQMRAGLDLTSSSAAVYVNSKYDAMKSGLDVTMSSATMYAKSRTTRASIIARINEDTGQAEALIDADNIRLTGNTTLDGKTDVLGSLSVSEGNLIVDKAFLVSGANQNNVTINNGKISGKTHQIDSGGELIFSGSQSGEHYNIDVSVLKNMIKSVSLDQDTNTLTLTPFYGNPINFSKATASVTLVGEWSSGVYSVRATSGTISGTIPSTTLSDNLSLGTPTKGTGVTVEATYDIGYMGYVDGQFVRVGSTGETGTISLNVASLLKDATTSSEKIIANGTYYPDANTYIGYSGITVDVPTSTPTMSYSWGNSGTLTLSTSPAFANSPFERKIVKGTETWGTGANVNKVTVDLNARYQVGSDWHEESTTGSIEVDASGRYSAGQTDAGLSIDFNNKKVQRSLSSSTKYYNVSVGSTGWENGKNTFSAKLGALDVDQFESTMPSVTIGGSWSNGKYAATAKHGTYEAGSASITMPNVSVDYNNGSWTNGNYSAAIKHGTYECGSVALTMPSVTIGGSWSNGKYAATAKHGTYQAGSTSITMPNVSVDYNNGSWSGDTYAANIKHGTYICGSVSINANTRYQAGWDEAISNFGIKVGAWTQDSSITLTKDVTGQYASSRTISIDIETRKYASTLSDPTYERMTIKGRVDSGSWTDIKYYNHVLEVGAFDANNRALAQIKSESGSSVFAQKTVDASSIFNNGYTSAKLKSEWGTGSDANKVTISKATTGSSTSVSYRITCDTAVTWDSSSNKFKAIPHAYSDGAERNTGSAAYSGVVSVGFNNLQGSGASAYRTAYVKNGSTTILTSGNLTDYGDGYGAGNTTGWNAGYDKAFSHSSIPAKYTASSSEPERTSFTYIEPGERTASGTDPGAYTRTYTISKGSTPSATGYAYVHISTKSGGTQQVGRISIGNWYTSGYTAGWTAAYNGCSIPSAQTTAVMTASWPSGTVDGAVRTRQYTLSVTGTYAYVRRTDSGNTTVVARTENAVTLAKNEVDDPSSDRNGTISAALNGTAIATQYVVMNKGSVNDAGKIAINARIRASTSNPDGNVTSRLWLTVAPTRRKSAAQSSADGTSAGTISGAAPGKYIWFSVCGRNYYFQLT